jgi:hypothetical protein
MTQHIINTHTTHLYFNNSINSYKLFYLLFLTQWHISIIWWCTINLPEPRNVQDAQLLIQRLPAIHLCLLPPSIQYCVASLVQPAIQCVLPIRELNAQLHSSRKLWLPRKSRNSLPFMNPEPVETSIQLYTLLIYSLLQYRYAPLNVLVDDRPHIQRWFHKIIILNHNIIIPLRYNCLQ